MRCVISAAGSVQGALGCRTRRRDAERQEGLVRRSVDLTAPDDGDRVRNADTELTVMGVVEDVVARVGAGVPAITLRPATNPATATTPTATTAAMSSRTARVVAIEDDLLPGIGGLVVLLGRQRVFVPV